MTEPTGWAEFRTQAFARSRLEHIASVGSPARLGYLVLGLCGEMNEAVYAIEEHAVSRAHAIDELGDVAWYMAMIEAESALPIGWCTFAPPTYSFQGLARRALHSTCMVAEVAKRPMQGRDLSPEMLQRAMTSVSLEFFNLLRWLEVSLVEVLAANIAKNHARFGDDAKGWTVEQQRALDSARRSNQTAG